MVFPPIWGGKWRRFEHAHASYPGLFFRPLGLSPYKGREERRVQGLDYTNPGLKVNRGNNFFCIKVLSIGYAFCSLNVLVLKTEGQKL